MGRKKTVGLIKRGEIWYIQKTVLGVKLRESTGTSEAEVAELILARRIEEIRQLVKFGVRREFTFREAAIRYMEENMHLSSISNIASYIEKLDPFIGHMPLNKIHGGTLKPFIDFRKKEGVKNHTINQPLVVVRTVLNLAARLWRDENGNTWLNTSPLIQLLQKSDARKPYPLSWDEQRLLFKELPDHLSKMCLFKVNTGTRESDVCGLRWDFEIDVPELQTSVFLIPGDLVKNREDRLIVLNDYAKSVVDSVRGQNADYVFSYKGKPVKTINNSGWKNARDRVGLKGLARVHDLKHTFGRRLRAAGVSMETIKVLLGHKNGDITAHYSSPEILELLTAANKICFSEVHKSHPMTLLKRKPPTVRAVSG
jgi:integrase